MSMRQADSAIRGYLYQFNKSIYEILQLADGAEITLEGVIEDIDIQSLSSTTTIQCKYHEDKKFKISDVAAPILEMFSHYCECNALGKSVSYILYAYYVDNPNSIDLDSILGFLSTTKDKDIQTKYFHRIYTIPDEGVLNLALKSQKSKDEKQTLFDYYTNNREKLVLKVPIRNFWNKFTYIPAEQFDVLQQAVIKEFSTIVDEDTAKNLYYPNAFSYVAHLSAKENVADRIVSKTTMLSYLSEQRSVLLSKWTLAAMDRSKVLKDKKEYLSGSFAGNTGIRAFVFSDAFLELNKTQILPFLLEYLGKYFKKPKLQQQPIFIFGSGHTALQQSVILGLYQYQKKVNTGMVGSSFVEDTFVNSTDCSPDYVCKIASEKDITVNILEKCHVNQFYIVGKAREAFNSPCYFVETLDVENINSLKYLIGLVKKLEV